MSVKKTGGARKRLAKIKTEPFWGWRYHEAMGSLPGTRLDGFLSEFLAAFSMLKASEDDPDFRPFSASARSGMLKAAAPILRAVGALDSAFLRELADTVDAFKNHKPEPDMLRASLILATRERRPAYTIAELETAAVAGGVPGSDTLPRRIRTICRELGIKIASPRGRRARES